PVQLCNEPRRRRAADATPRLPPPTWLCARSSAAHSQHLPLRAPTLPAPAIAPARDSRLGSKLPAPRLSPRAASHAASSRSSLAPAPALHAPEAGQPPAQRHQSGPIVVPHSHDRLHAPRLLRSCLPPWIQH